MSGQWKLRLVSGEPYPTPFHLPPGVFRIGAVGDDISALCTFTLLRDGRWQFGERMSIAGPNGEEVVFQYVPRGTELCGLRVKLVSGPVEQNEDSLLEHEITFFIQALCIE